MFTVYGATLSTTLKISSRKFRDYGDLNLGLMGEKREHYLCAMQPPISSRTYSL